MAGTYVYSDNNKIVAELVCMAKAANQTVCLLCTSHKAAEELDCFGADKILILNGGSPAVENNAKDIAGLLKEQNVGVFLVGATSRGRDLAARVAGYLDCAMASDVSSVNYIDGGVVAERTLYGGMVQQSQTLVGMAVITVGAGIDAIACTSKSIIEVVDINGDPRLSIVESVPIVKGESDLKSADIVVGIGLGVQQKSDLDMIGELAASLNAGIGCSRGISEDREWLPVERYIGISGQVLKPSLYIALALSGQIQHIYGVRDSKIIVGINSDPNARIFQVADYGIVGDIYEVVPLLTQAVKGI